MNLSGMIIEVVEAFRQDLEGLVEKTTSSSWTPEEFTAFVSGLKQALSRAGLAAFEQTVQAQDEGEDVACVERDGVVSRFKMSTDKEWLTPFGLAKIGRRYYQPDAGGVGRAPLDERCGMVDRYMTPDVEEMVAFGAAHLVPREVETLLGKVLPRGPSATAIQRVVKDVGRYAEAHGQQIENAQHSQSPLTGDGDVLVVSWDGVMVPMRQAGVERGRPPERPGARETKPSPTVWKEAGVATVSVYRRARDSKDKPERQDARYFARMPEPGMATLVGQVEECVWEVSQERRRETVVLCDGKPAIWDVAGVMPACEGATLILDFFHAVTHLSNAAAALFGKDSPKAKRWCRKYRSRLRHEPGAIDAVIRSMCYYARQLAKGTEAAETVRRARRYFSRNRDKMDYAGFRARGLPIGSGPVEAAAKNVVGARIKRSGMRWTKDGGQNVLNLRTHVLSKRWDTFWDTYQQDRAA